MNKCSIEAMFESSTSNSAIKSSRIRAIWTIMTFAILVILINGCAGMRSVRGTKAYHSDKKITKTEAPDDKEISSDDEYADMLSQFENKFHKPDSEVQNDGIDFQDASYIEPNDNNEQIAKNETAENSKRLPTLSEQMKSLSNGQEEIKSKVDELQLDVNEIKGTLDEIKDVIYDMSGTKPLPKTGLPVSKKTNTIKTNNNTDNNIILPDEKIEGKKPEPKKITQPRKTNSTKSKENKTFTVKPVNYITPDIKEDEAVETNEEKIEEKQENNVSANEKYDIAFSQFKARRFNEAISLFSDIVKAETDPKIVSDSYYWLGESYFGMEQYGKAMDYFRKVSSAGANSKLDNAQLMIAECLIRSGQINDAKNAFKELIAKYPDSSFVPRARKMLQQL
jgi:TolA-binding protein